MSSNSFPIGPAARRLRVAAIAALTTGSLLIAPAVASGASSSGSARPSTATPSVASYVGVLNAINANSATRAWAVGAKCAFMCGGMSTKTLRWNGTKWTYVTSPSLNAMQSLNGARVFSASNAWAAGVAFNPGTGYGQSLVLHWNGTKWARSSSPNPGAWNQLHALGMSSPTNGWAVGNYCPAKECSKGNRTLILRWNGRSWTRAASPNPSFSSELTGVSVVSATDAWAVGRYCPRECMENVGGHTMILHWNGVAWSRVTSPDPGAGWNELLAVRARTATDAWAVGGYCASTCDGPASTLILHWNGAAWSKVASPNESVGNVLSGVTATSATDAWAVGRYCTTDVCGEGSTAAARNLIEHWNGVAWSKVNSPNPNLTPSGWNRLNAVTATSATDAWAAGGYCSADCDAVGFSTQILHWNGASWSRS